MPEHAEVFAHCPVTAREHVSSPPAAHHALPYTNQIVGEMHERHAQEELDAQEQAHMYQQQARAASYMQSAPLCVQSPMHMRSRTPVQLYQVYGASRGSSGVEVEEREVREEWEVREVEVDAEVEETSPYRPTPPSPSTPSTTVAVVHGINDNDTATMTRSSAVEAKDMPDAILDPSPETIIHPKGNLVLIVGSAPRQRSLLVQAETIEHFGPPWQDIIKSSHRERLLSTRRTCYLPGDDADMMLVLMYLSHPWHVGKVPKELSFRQLLAMARVCAGYDMNAQVSPFVRRWIVPHQDRLLSPGREEWLFIAHQFGLERHYVTLAQHLVLGCRTEGGRMLFPPGRAERLAGLVPDCALVEIRRKRIKALSTILDIVYKHIDRLENGNTCRATLPPSPDEETDVLIEAERAMCTHCNHGELIRYLKIHDFWPPIMQSAHVKRPVNDVLGKLTRIPAISYRLIRNSHAHVADPAALGSSASASGNAHAVCDIGRQLAVLIADAQRKLEMPIALCTVEEMRRNAENVGLKDEAVAPNYLPVEEEWMGEVDAVGRR
ncbi:hypothetical protein PMIN02_012827 [Paraphaeosphaeria minitans]